MDSSLGLRRVASFMRGSLVSLSEAGGRGWNVRVLPDSRLRASSRVRTFIDWPRLALLLSSAHAGPLILILSMINGVLTFKKHT